MTSINQTLRQAGLKITLSRVKVLQTLMDAEPKRRHLTAEDVYKELVANDEPIGLGTIYRILAQFEEANLVVRHHFTSSPANFELARGRQHYHMVCEESGEIVELTDTALYEQKKREVEQLGYKLVGFNLVLYVEEGS
ncbi:MAG: transcriptional repressor [Porticoccaceae bacterium]|nr:transcriptional repressor [Porticoccaceae bacterium]